MILFLGCLFFTLYSYTSELTLLEKVQKSYPHEYYTPGKVHFCDTNTKQLISFDDLPELKNIFSQKSWDTSVVLDNLPKRAELIDLFSDVDIFSPESHAKFIYDLKIFMYKFKNQSSIQDTYQSYLATLKQDLSTSYEKQLYGLKLSAFASTFGITALFSSLGLAMTQAIGKVDPFVNIFYAPGPGLLLLHIPPFILLYTNYHEIMKKFNKLQNDQSTSLLDSMV
jgi:hypothetical protein